MIGSCCVAGAENGAAVPAVQGIVAAFQKHPVVIIGEARHGLAQMGEIYQALVRDPAFQNTVQDIVIEFASQHNQRLVDEYVNGAALPITQVRHIWRDTTKVASWEFPIYWDWLAAIREVNQKLPSSRRFRVLAGDTAIDWPRIKTHEDWVALGDNNTSFANVIVEQVLKKKRHAVVILGGNHVTKSGDRTGAPNTTTRVEARYPGSTYVVVHHMPPSGSEGEFHLLNGKAPALYDLSVMGSPSLSVADAFLYVGPRESLTETWPAPGSLEVEYMKEVDRRSMIEWGELCGRKFLGAAAAR
jgi:hypothetical protein